MPLNRGVKIPSSGTKVPSAHARVTRPGAGLEPGPDVSLCAVDPVDLGPDSTSFAFKARSGATTAVWRGAAAGLGAAFGTPGVAAAALLSGAVAAYREDIPSRKLTTGLATAATQAAWGSMGAVFGIPGAVTSVAGAMVDGLKAEDISRAHRRLEVTAAKPTQPGPTSDKIHVVTVVDAGESVYASEYLQQMEEAKAEAGDRLQADLRLQRSPSPLVNLMGGAIWTTMMIAGSAALPNPWLGATAATTLLTLMPNRTTSALARGAAGLTMPRWSGRRDYEVVADQSRGYDSRIVTQREPEPGPPVMGVPRQPESHLGETQDFIKTALGRVPAGLKVVHLAGHGLGYRQSAGLSYQEFGQLLATLDEAGPLDLLVLDSCLVSNLTALSRVPSSTRYVLASEENITIGDMPETFKAALRATPDGPLDARQFGRALVENATSEKGTVPYTLALIDNARLPALNSSVGKLGALLADDLKAGGKEWLQPILKKAKRFPQHSFLQRQMIGLGDLKMVAEGILEARTRDPIGQAAAQVLENLDQAVIARQTSADYAGTGGISIQLPGSWGHRAKGLLPYHDIQDTGAPEGWKALLKAYAQ